MLEDHPLRREMIGELHSRPFLAFQAPAEVLHLAFKPVDPPISLDHEAVLTHLNTLLKIDGKTPAGDDINHLVSQFGDLKMKFELHTEFISYTFVKERAAAAPFSSGPEDWLPHDWLASAPGKLIASCWLHAESADSPEDAEAKITGPLREHFHGDSLASAWVSGGRCATAADFRLDPRGQTRFALVTTPGLGARRIGRVAQRLIEMETYRALAMLALPVARRVGRRLPEIGGELSEVILALTQERAVTKDRETLDRLTKLSAELERLSSDSTFRLSAARAYHSIVDDRIRTLREERIVERQAFQDFMVRRFLPAMRTCQSVDSRLEALSQRAERAGNLLRTRVDVSLEEQNQELLQSMNERAALQLRLQQTVEGLSVVAISYYAVSLAGFLIAPLADAVGWPLSLLKAIAALPIIGAVWYLVRQIRNRVETASPRD
ncbi:MAG: DUF3422 domain-containing protein [Pseudomonadota bacterium]